MVQAPVSSSCSTVILPSSRDSISFCFSWGPSPAILSAIEYSVCLLNLNKPYKEAIAVLNMSRLYGLSDPRYIATLGGLLFLDGSFSEAQGIFSESSKHNFSATEMNQIQFYPRDPHDINMPLRFQGKVKYVKAGYAIIESLGYPDFLCPSSKYDGIIITPGLPLTFEPVFTAKGHIAIYPKMN